MARPDGLFRKCALALVCVLLASCGPVPGGELEGEIAAAPSDWATFLEGDGGICEVESRPSDPHSIQLYCFVHDGALFAQSHRWAQAAWWPVESWALIWMEHPEVKVRIGSSLFELRATRVTNDETRTAAGGSVGYDELPEGIVLFRFDARE